MAGIEMPAAATATPDFKACRRVSAISLPPNDRLDSVALDRDYSLGLTLGKGCSPRHFGFSGQGGWAETHRLCRLCLSHRTISDSRCGPMRPQHAWQACAS